MSKMIAEAETSVTPFHKGIKEIPSQEYLRECFDYRDGELIWKDRPRSHFPSPQGFASFKAKCPTGKRAGCAYPNGYFKICLNRMNFLFHRVVWVYHNGAIPEGKLIDHRDCNPGNNRIENLRLCSFSENGMNSNGWKKKRSGLPKGVTPRGGDFEAQIKINYRNIRLGVFATVKEASEAYQKAAKELHGEFMRQPHPQPESAAI